MVITFLKVSKKFHQSVFGRDRESLLTIGHHLKLPLEIGLIQITPHAQNCKSNIFSIYQTESSMRYSDIVSLYIPTVRTFQEVI